MATVYPTAAGLWSNRTWNDDATGAAYSLGTPQAGDTVLMNNVDVEIDQNVTVSEIRNNAGTNAVAGGRITFTNNSNGLAVNADLTARTTLAINLSGTPTFTINGNITGGTVASGFGLTMESSSAATVTVNGNVSGGTANSSHGLVVGGTSAPTVTINGNLSAGTGAVGAPSFGLNNFRTAALITVNGTVFSSASITSGIGLVGIGNTGFGFKRIQKAVFLASAPFTGAVDFIDPTDPECMQVRDIDRNPVFLTAATTTTAAKPSLRGGFAN